LSQGNALPGIVGSVLLLLCLLQIKHLFADFFLQTHKMLSGRNVYLHSGRAQHAGVHALGSVVVFVIMGAPVGFILAICLAEWVVHFHIDYWKAQYTEKKTLNPQQALFWRAVGTDQCLHQLTYIAMAAVWVKCAIS
jgi:Protein of unknown function (DUF3307)